MAKVLLIGTGGVGSVVAHKCYQAPEVFHSLVLANRSPAKALNLRDRLGRSDVPVESVDADDTAQVVALIGKHRPELVINTALPYQDLAIMEACLETRTHYLDTANYEPPDEARYQYSWQWKYHDAYARAGIMGLLGSGFDPGVTNVFCAYAKKHLLDEIHTIDILDANAGEHGRAFATNFNPEINIREITAPGRYYQDGSWREIPALSVHHSFDFPQIGPKEVYLLNHEEMESLVVHFPEIRRIRFWMTFSPAYLTHLEVLQNVGMTSIRPVPFQGRPIVPLQFLKAVLPEPSSLGQSYSGKTCIGCVVGGLKNSRKKTLYLYNICDHAACFREVGAQAIAYTTGVPAMIGAKMILQGHWKGAGVFNLEQFDPDPFMNDLNRFGLPWQVRDVSELAF